MIKSVSRRLLLSLVAPLLAVAASAQTTDNAQQQTIDSLRQAVTELQEEKQMQEEERRLERIWRRTKHWGISYVTSQKLTNEDIDGLEWKSSWGLRLYQERTTMLHRKPIAGVMKFGLDWSLMDMSYVKYKDPYEGQIVIKSDDDIDFGLQQIQYSLSIGPSLTINPVDHLLTSVFFHFKPTASVALLDSEASWAYVSNFSLGFNIAYKVIGIGLEYQWGKGKYNSFDTDDIDDDYDYPDNADVSDVLSDLFSKKTKMKTQTLFLNVSLRY